MKSLESESYTGGIAGLWAIYGVLETTFTRPPARPHRRCILPRSRPAELPAAGKLPGCRSHSISLEEPRSSSGVPAGRDVRAAPGKTAKRRSFAGAARRQRPQERASVPQVSRTGRSESDSSRQLTVSAGHIRPYRADPQGHTDQGERQSGARQPGLFLPSFSPGTAGGRQVGDACRLRPGSCG